MEKYSCILFDHRFCLYEDLNQNIHFTHWHDFKKNEIRELQQGQQFYASTIKSNSSKQARGLAIKEIQLTKDKSTFYSKTFKDCHLSQEDLLTHCQSFQRNTLIFINCRFSNLEITNFEFHQEVAFINCTFNENSRFINCQFKSNLWFPNCIFKKHFSLKGSSIAASIHMEGTNFSGVGGASFRGLESSNLYLDFGVIGGDDLFWLNEMRIEGVVTIGGTFNNEIQFLFKQDENEELNSNPIIGSILIGQELYPFERINKTYINENLKIHSMTLKKELTIDELICSKISIQGSSIPKINITNCSINTDCIISDNIIGLSIQKKPCLSVTESSIGRHLKVDSNVIFNELNLSSSAVSEISYMENNNFHATATLNLNRFSASRFLIYPPESLFNNSKSRIFKPKEFSLLRETDPRLLADQYCSLKHWLADAGKLELEDIAFFHMRHNSHTRKLTQLFMGGVFGWGVRLSNIAISSILTIVLFSLIFHTTISSSTLSKSFALSVQGFISSFFGEWSSYDPDGTVSTIVTIESIIGILFITVFIGAYIRKLLR